MAHRNRAGWIKAYQEKNAYWLHDGNFNRPHALLSSGKHSSGFFNSRPVIADEPLLAEAASDLLDSYITSFGDMDPSQLEVVDVVVGPQTGATKLAELIAAKIGRRRNRPCKWASPAKSEKDGAKGMVFDDPEHTVLPGEKVLLCEDVITTAGSVKLTADAVTNLGGAILPFVLVLVNRSNMMFADDRKIVALIDVEMPIWEPGVCPLCAHGSEAIRPKDQPEWARLNAEYPEPEPLHHSV